MLSYIIIPSIAVITLLIGRRLTFSGMAWYKTIALPSFTPSKWIFGVVWQTLYVLVVICVLRVWNTFPRNRNFYLIIGLFCVNIALNLLWSYLFFVQHAIGVATIEAAVHFIVMTVLILLLARQDRVAAMLLVPYLMWLLFATYLNYSIWLINS